MIIKQIVIESVDIFNNKLLFSLLTFLNPIPAGVLENQDLLTPPPSNSALLLQSAKSSYILKMFAKKWSKN